MATWMISMCMEISDEQNKDKQCVFLLMLKINTEDCILSEILSENVFQSVACIDFIDFINVVISALLCHVYACSIEHISRNKNVIKNGSENDIHSSILLFI